MKRFLILEDGTVFSGYAFGAPGEVIAEIVFNTSMTGCIEMLTDQCYYGQGIVQTFPLAGNYGIISEDAEADKTGASAFIVREYCESPSNFRCEEEIDTYLKRNNIVGLYGIDTRALTRILRSRGTMNGMIADHPSNADLEAIRKYKAVDAVKNVSTKEVVNYKSEEGKYKVALLDYGVRNNVISSLVERGCDVVRLPYDTTAEDVLSYDVDGIFLSNGPGDPNDVCEAVETIKNLMTKDIPIMGICLGHQLLALANGFKTEKMKFGHRGSNHPAYCAKTDKTYITQQNHSHTVILDSVDPDVAEEYFVNLNDGTNEGLIYKNIPAFSVQFMPNSCGGPAEDNELFNRFIAEMDAHK
ncbi:MAG: glutamine-hydrolyzing carbamoyl-phosphate synthase small subunit [Clostridia bacterium]|nr:glutamine-hydrolyzing carbamoyl-phosphate synthase small subunit [Clostridia bacterium]